MYYVFFILGKTIIIDELDYDWFLYLTRERSDRTNWTSRDRCEKYLNYLQ